MRAAFLLRPVLDALVPEDPPAVGRRIRGAAVCLAVAAWLLPEFRGLGTDTTARRAAICAAFLATAVAAHRYAHGRRARVALPALCLVDAAVVAGCGGVWGFGFLAFAAFVAGAADARRRFLPLPPAETEPDALPPIPGGRPAFLHGAAWLVLSVFVLKQYVGQSMVVPTGSMQPTIMGAAGRSFPPPSRSGPLDRLVYLLRATQYTGDWLFVENVGYAFRDPRRFEIVVFQFPLFRERNFVKRVVGLPGEHLEIKGGDIWVNGKIARKPPVVQETLWRELFPRPSFVARKRTIQESFTQDVATGGNWKPVSGDEVRCDPGKAESAVVFNSSGSYSDVRIEFTAVPDGSAVVRARITSRGAPVTLVLDAAGASGGSYLDVSGKQVALKDVEVAGGGPVRVQLCVADGEAWALVDGREVARADVPLDKRGRNRIEIGASGKPVTFRDVRVDRDIVYDAGGGPGVYDVPKDGFFFIGDNVGESEDSRKWVVDVFHPPGGGAPIRAAEDYPDEKGNPHGGRVHIEDGRYRFLDVDGVPRDLPRDGTTVERGVPWPFARRDHLLGRAVMIGWPWFPADAGFRPRLLP